jgi:hypothetical protein
LKRRQRSISSASSSAIALENQYGGSELSGLVSAGHYFLFEHGISEVVGQANWENIHFR